MKKIICICMSIIFVLTGCSGKEKNAKSDLAANQYKLTATDESQLLISLPDNYTAASEEKEQSALKAYYCSNKTEPLTLHYFQETDDYSLKNIQSELESFESQYQTLVDSNSGTMDSTTGLTEFSIGEQSGQYIALTYTLDKHSSYCAEFYLQKDDHILHGTQRLNTPPKEDVSALVEKLLSMKE